MSNWLLDNERLVFSNSGVSFAMIKVPGGDYMIGETPVTQDLWELVMRYNPSHFSNNPRLPVEQVSCIVALKFIEKLNELTSMSFRLPTVEEWEYAARGGSKSNYYRYPGSNDINEVAWTLHNSKGKTHPVKSKLPNEIGLYDMLGNVWEWSADEIEVPNDSVLNAFGLPPSGRTETHKERILKGGSCMNSPKTNTISGINHFSAGYSNYHMGFRLAL